MNERPVLKNVSILGIGRTVAIGLAFAQSVVVARILGPETFGAVALIAAYPSLIFGILNVRTSEITTRFLADYDAQGVRSRALGLCKVAYGLDLTAATVAFAIVALTAVWVAPIFLDDDQLVPLTTVYALSLVPAAMGPTSVSIFSVTGRFLLTGGLEIVGATLRTGLVIGLVVAGLGIPGVVYGTVVANTILGVFTVVTAHRVVVRRWGASWLRSGWRQLVGQRREIAKFFVFSDLNAFLGVAVKGADVLILGIFRPTIEIGYYTLGKSITAHLLNLVSSVRVVAFPQVMRLWSLGEWDAMWRYVCSHMWTISVPGIAVVGLLVLVIEPAIELVYGLQFAPATLVARLLLLQVVLSLLSIWIGMVFTAWGDIHVRLTTNAVSMILAMTIIVLFAPRWGIIAAAAALLFQQALSVLVTVIWVYAHRATRAREAADRLRTQAGRAVT